MNPDQQQRRARGASGEAAAAAYLGRAGYAVVARNLRLAPFGEVDIVAQRDGVTVLVEVRTRLSSASGFGPAVASLSPGKQVRMRRAADAYLAAHPAAALRIDLIAITLDRSGQVVSLEHIENAVEG